LTRHFANRPQAALSAPRSEVDVEGVLSQVNAELHRIGGDARTRVSAVEQRLEELDGRQRDVEQALAARQQSLRGGDSDLPSPGRAVCHSEAFRSAGGSGSNRIVVSAPVNTITSASTSAGSLISPDRRNDIVGLPRRRLTVRALLAPGQTNSNLVQYSRQVVRTNNAAVVSEGTLKPESNYEWVLDEAPVRTIAHWVPVSRQSMDDAPLLQSTIDGELRYGLQLAEENELLFGSGSGQHIHGIVPQATPYDTSRDGTGETRFDTLAHALAQSEVALLPATGIVLNVDDLESLKLIKDGEGRYIGGGPFGPPITSIWGRPVVGTPAMTKGHFLVGAFMDGAQIFDRMDAEILISSEDRDNFVKNMLTVRAEQRLAMSVKRPAAFIYGSF